MVSFIIRRITISIVEKLLFGFRPTYCLYSNHQLYIAYLSCQECLYKSSPISKAPCASFMCPNDFYMASPQRIQWKTWFLVAPIPTHFLIIIRFCFFYYGLISCLTISSFYINSLSSALFYTISSWKLSSTRLKDLVVTSDLYLNWRLTFVCNEGSQRIPALRHYRVRRFGFSEKVMQVYIQAWPSSSCCS